MIYSSWEQQLDTGLFARYDISRCKYPRPAIHVEKCLPAVSEEGTVRYLFQY